MKKSTDILSFPMHDMSDNPGVLPKVCYIYHAVNAVVSDDACYDKRGFCFVGVFFYDGAPHISSYPMPFEHKMRHAF